MNRPLVSVLLASLVAMAGCQSQVATIKPGRPAYPRASSPGTEASLAGKPVQNGVRLTLRGAIRLTTDFGVQLVSNNGGGTVSGETGRILSNNSGNVISNNGGNLVSNNSGGLVSNNSGGLVSSNGGGLVGNDSASLVSSFGGAIGRAYRLLSQDVTPEDRLADAVVEVTDVTGAVLLDASKKPIQARSGPDGEYVLDATLPRENFVLRVRLLSKLGGDNSELRAMVVPGAQTGELSAPIDTTSSLAAGYVLSEYVKGRNEVFNRLPADANAELQRDVSAARRLLKDKPAYNEDGLRSVVAGLRKSDTALDRTLEKVKALLLIGQERLGSGLKATDVPLTLPGDILRDRSGDLLIAEQVGRIRRVTSDGTITMFAGEQWDEPVRDGALANEVGFKTIHSMLLEPSGSILLTDRMGNYLIRITPEGRVSILAGTGEKGQDALPAPARQTRLENPEGLALSPDGDIYLTDKGRVTRLDPSGTLHPVSQPFTGNNDAKCLCFTGDGALWAANKGTLWRRDPKNLEWKMIVGDISLTVAGYLQADGTDGVYLSESGRRQVIRVNSLGETQVLIPSLETPRPGFEANAARRGVMQPFGFVVGPDNKLLVCDLARALVQEFDLNDTSAAPRTLAGTQSVYVTGESQSLGVNVPGGMTLTPDGNGVIYTEVAGSAIKRFQDQSVSIVAGSTLAVSARGAQETLVMIAPLAVAYDARGNLWAIVGDGPRLVRIDPQGQAERLAGNGLDTRNVRFEPTGKSALDVALGQPIALTIGPDGLPYWTDIVYHNVCRLGTNGQIEVVVGAVNTEPKQSGGDNGSNKPARDIKLNMPYGLAFDSQGDLYVSDGANMRILKVAMRDPERRVTTFMGQSLIDTLGTLSQASAYTIPEQTPLREALAVAPAPLFIDRQDRLYIGELGTVRLGQASGLANFNFAASLPKFGAYVRVVNLKAENPMVELLAGPGGTIFKGKYGPDSLGSPSALIVDTRSRLFVADSLNNQIKMAPIPLAR